MLLTYSRPSPLQQVQLARRLVIAVLMLGGLFVLPFVCAVWLHAYPLVHSQIENIGILLIFVAIAGRTWCALHIGGRKKAVLVETGPFSVVRNPLYVFNIVGTAGMAAQSSSMLVVAGCTALTACVFALVTRREESFLSEKFGSAYQSYTARVPRFVPKFSLYRSVPHLTIDMRVVRRTFIESSYFLIAIPAFDAFELARTYGLLPDLFHLP